MVDPVADKFFCSQFDDPSNRACCDSGAASPEWASVSHGVYLSIGAAGVHRSLGVRVSFVQSTSMDSWRPVHLRMMELGGNQRFADFLRSQGVAEDLPIRQKYSTRAAQWYRENLRALAEGQAPPPPLPPGVGHLPVDDGSEGAGAELLDRVFAAPRGDGEQPLGAGGMGGAAAAGPAEEQAHSLSKQACECLKSAFRAAAASVSEAVRGKEGVDQATCGKGDASPLAPAAKEAAVACSVAPDRTLSHAAPAA
uniref:Arf-GAP domain-containing protein n=1 Tax=Pyrodinium bahamense TaxID=73915 RepID=A0A7S0AE39_9DINO